MFNVIIVIGTRPQYIKLKPLYDFIKHKKCNYMIVDTNQHYDDNMSQVFIDELELDIDIRTSVKNTGSITFLANTMIKIDDIICKNKPDIVLVMGDTNSTLAAALVCNKRNITFGHIEAGVRCWNKKRPEEVNRIIVDELADIHFISREKDSVNVSNPVYIGDLEYAYLNKLEEQNKIESIVYEDWYLMTIHRQCNMSMKKMNNIFSLCKNLKKDVMFPIHHRTKSFIEENSINIPDNVKVVDPVSYFEMLKLLSRCGGIITDSGGISKISPFFGKKCIIPSIGIEWPDVIELGYSTFKLDRKWFDDKKIDRNKDLYYCKEYKDNIWNGILNLVG